MENELTALLLTGAIVAQTEQADRPRTQSASRYLTSIPRKAWFGLSLAFGLVGTINAIGAYAAYNPPPYSSVHPSGPGFMALASVLYTLTVVSLAKALTTRQP